MKREEIMTNEELLQEIVSRIGTEEFDHAVDQVEWTDPKYNHQN